MVDREFNFGEWVNVFGGKGASWLLALSLLAPLPILAQSSHVWDGSGNNDSFWSTKQNWLGNNLPPTNSNVRLIFTGSQRRTNIMDQNYLISSIVFSNLAGAFNLTGSSLLTLTAGLVNNSTNLQTISITRVLLPSNQTWSAAAGNVLVSSAITNNAVTLTLDAAINRTMTLSGTVSGAGSLLKSGVGTSVLSGANTFTGGTTVSAGTLLVNNTAGSGTGTGAVTVGSGATLGGTGSLTGTVGLSGTLASGAGVGTFTTGAETWAGGANYKWEIADASGVAGSGWDLVNIVGDLTINATTGNKFTLNITSLTLGGLPGNATNFDNTLSYDWVILAGTTPITGFDPNAFLIDTSGFANSMGLGQFFLTTENGNRDLVLHFAAVPEPGTVGLIALGCLGLLLHHSRRPRS